MLTLLTVGCWFSFHKSNSFIWCSNFPLALSHHLAPSLQGLLGPPASPQAPLRFPVQIRFACSTLLRSSLIHISAAERRKSPSEPELGVLDFYFDRLQCPPACSPPPPPLPFFFLNGSLGFCLLYFIPSFTMWAFTESAVESQLETEQCSLTFREPCWPGECFLSDWDNGKNI